MSELNQQVSQQIMEQVDLLTQDAVDRQYALQTDFWKPYSSQPGYQKSLRDAGYHFSYLAESLAANDPSLFLDYVGWVKVLFAGLNFPPSVLTTSLDTMKQAIRKAFPAEMAAVACETIDSALEKLPDTSETLDSFIVRESPLYDLTTHYHQTLLSGDRHLASQLIMDAVKDGTSVKDIYMHVFQPSQQEIGRLWQMNQVSVAQEHFSTAATQLIMSQLYPYIFATEKTGNRLVATSVGGELHEIGVRMVTDFLEMEGWDTYYLGANTPTDSILRTIEDRQPGVMAISATITTHVSKVAALIDSIHASVNDFPVKVIVGGYPFNVARNLYHQVGADGYARNAQEAISVAQSLVEMNA